MSDITVTPYQLDALKEHLNIGVGDAANDLGTMLKTEIHLEVPSIQVMGVSDIAAFYQEERLASVTLPFRGEISGSASVVFSSESALKLIDLLIEDGQSPPEDPDIDELKESTLIEVGNIIANSVMASLSDAFHMEIEYTPPVYREESFADILMNSSMVGNKNSIVVFGETFFIVESVKIKGNIYLAFIVKDLQFLLNQWAAA